MNRLQFCRDSRLAFRNHCEYACAVERPPKRIACRIWLSAVLAYAVFFVIWSAK